MRLAGSGAAIGSVADIFSGTGQHDTMVVQLPASDEDIVKCQMRSVMVPFAKAIVPVVDLKGRFIEIQPPEGLLDLVQSEPMKKSVRAALLAAHPKAATLTARIEAAAAAAAERRDRKLQKSTSAEDRVAAAALIEAAKMAEIKAAATPAELSSRRSPAPKPKAGPAGAADANRLGSKPPGSGGGGGRGGGRKQAGR